MQGDKSLAPYDQKKIAKWEERRFAPMAKTGAEWADRNCEWLTAHNDQYHSVFIKTQNGNGYI